MFEARVAKLEALAESTDRRLGLMEQDLRALRDKVDKHFILTFGAIIAAALGLAGLIAGLAGLMAKGFGWLT